MWRPGDLVDGRFVLERVAGTGGRAAVWRAVDTVARDAVALKLVGGLSGDPIAAVAAEIDALAHVRHDAVVACRGWGRADERTAYLALTWIDGEPLSARIARRPLSVRDALALARRIAEALAAIHDAGLVHGDLKPANVLLPGGDPGLAVVVDLGIARGIGSGGSEPAGTPAYMAPEQARGEAIDLRADLWSLGTVLHEALTGRPAFAGDSAAAVLSRVLFEPPASLVERRPGVPPSLAGLIDTLMSKDPSLRPASATTVRARLDDLEASATHAGDPVAVGGDEMRALSVAVVRGAEYPASSAVAIRRALGSGARVGLLGADITIAIEGSIATDRALAAARAAQTAHLATGLAVGVAAGTGVLRGDDVSGELVALARGLATDGVHVDDATAELIATRFEVADGRLGAERRSDGQRTVLGKLTPLVGRDRELQMLVALADECAAEQAPRVAIVTAPPGLGKSRLRRELSRRLAHSFTVWLGRGDPVRAGAPLAALADLVRASLEPLGGFASRAALLTIMRAHVADPARVAAFLGELLGLPLDDEPSPQLLAARANPILMNDQLRRAVVDWLRAAPGPLALVLEDFHWGDDATLRFLDAALRQLRERAVLIVTVGRPSLLDASPGAFAAHHPLTIRLGPLSSRAATQLVRAALPSLDDLAVARLVERGAGNPFFLEELIRQHASGVAGDLPSTIVSMVQARLDDLDLDARRALRAAAVLGPHFSRGAVAALLGLPSSDADLVTWLDELTRRELVVRRRPSPIPADDELVFAHDLVREAADALLTEEDRAAAHRAAAAWLEQRPGADPVALASHWERGGAPARAATWQRRAAEVALAANDFAAALAALTRAALLGAPPSASADLLAAEAHAWRGELPDAAAAAESAMRHAPLGSSPWWRGLASAVTARGRQGDHDAVETLAAYALSTRPLDPDAVPAYLASLTAVGRQLFHIARYEEAHRAMAMVFAAGEPASLPPLVAAQVHGLFAAAARHRGDLADDLAGYRRVLSAFEAAGDLRSACNTRVSVAFAHIELGQWSVAESELLAALADAERLGLAPVATRARQNLALVWSHHGRLSDAAALLDRVILEAREQENSRFEGWTRVYRARIALASTDLPAARAQIRGALALLATSPPALAGARAVWSQVLVASGRHAEAVTEASLAVATVDDLGGIEEFESLARLALIEAHLASGDPESARLAIARAADRLHERAAAIGDASLRTTFLDQVPENRRILELSRMKSTPRG